MYKLYLRPHLEYCISVWSPQHRGGTRWNESKIRCLVFLSEWVSWAMNRETVCWRFHHKRGGESDETLSLPSRRLTAATNKTWEETPIREGTAKPQVGDRSIVKLNVTLSTLESWAAGIIFLKKWWTLKIWNVSRQTKITICDYNY